MNRGDRIFILVLALAGIAFVIAAAAYAPVWEPRHFSRLTIED